MEGQYVYFSEDHSAPYSDMVVMEGKYLFLSGLIAEDLGTREILSGDITFETKTVLDNLETILERYGSDMDHIVRLEILLRDFSERDVMNEEYRKHFNADHMPARLCFGDVGLAGTCKIEIMATAYKKD